MWVIVRGFFGAINRDFVRQLYQHEPMGRIADRGPDGADVLFHISGGKLSSFHPGCDPLDPIRSDDKFGAVVVRRKHFSPSNPVKPGDIGRVHPPAARAGGMAGEADGPVIPLVYETPLKQR